MKIDRLETHDRFEHFTKQDFDISRNCQNIIDKRPFGNNPFYIFAHTRTIGYDEKCKLFTTGRYETFGTIPEKKLIWQPRLTKPKAQSNSMLFKAYPGTDTVKVIWMIPAKELWGQYKKENVTGNEIVFQSIHDYTHNKEKLEERETDDLSDFQIDAIYREMSTGAKYKRI